MEKKVTTLDDVAKKAGVSRITVSRILRGSPNHRPRTISLVNRTAKELGYRPNAIARAFRTNKTGVIGLLVQRSKEHDLLGEIFYSTLISTLETRLIQKDYSILLGGVSYEDIISRQMPSIVQQGYCEGVVTLRIDDDEYLRELNRNVGSVVTLDFKTQCVPSVSVAHYRGGFQMGRHMIQLGHRKFAFLTAPNPSGNFGSSFDGFRAALAEADLSQDVPVASCNWASAQQPAIQRLMTTGHDFTAVFCANDYLALVAIREFRNMGLRVPEDISVAGFDDLETSILSSPALTTIRVDRKAMGEHAVDLILGSLKSDRKSKDYTGLNIEIPVELIPRDSVIPNKRNV